MRQLETEAMWTLMLAAALAAPPEPYDLLASSEPFGQGDDRTASTLEAAVLAPPQPIGPCRQRGIDAGDAPTRFVSLKVWVRMDGRIKKSQVLLSTGSDAVDQCVTEAVGALVLSPAPMFDDKLRLNLTWSVVAPEEDDAPAEAEGALETPS